MAALDAVGSHPVRFQFATVLTATRNHCIWPVLSTALCAGACSAACPPPCPSVNSCRTTCCFPRAALSLRVCRAVCVQPAPVIATVPIYCFSFVSTTAPRASHVAGLQGRLAPSIITTQSTPGAGFARRGPLAVAGEPVLSFPCVSVHPQACSVRICCIDRLLRHTLADRAVTACKPRTVRVWAESPPHARRRGFCFLCRDSGAYRSWQAFEQQHRGRRLFAGFFCTCRLPAAAAFRRGLRQPSHQRIVVSFYHLVAII